MAFQKPLNTLPTSPPHTHTQTLELTQHLWAVTLNVILINLFLWFPTYKTIIKVPFTAWHTEGDETDYLPV